MQTTRGIADVADLVAALIPDAPVAPGSIGVDRSTPPETRLDAIGFDSLAFVEFGAAVQERWGLMVESVVEVQTLGDLADLVQRATPAAEDPSYIPPGLGRYQAPAQAAMRPLFPRLFPFEVEGLERIATSGPVLLCMNHDSAFDIVYTVNAIPRPVAVMSKAEVFLGPVTSRLIHEMGGFRVERDRFDRLAVLIAQELLDRGQVLAMYPEGTRRAGSLLPFLPGAAYIALSRGLPMVPVALVGTDRVLPRDKNLPQFGVPVRVIVGEPMPVEREEEPVRRLRRAAELTDELRDRISAMLLEADPTRR